MAGPELYVEHGLAAARSVFFSELAVVWPELEARLSDARHPASPFTLDPHILTEVKRRLLKNGEIAYARVVETRGREVGLLHSTDLRGRTGELEGVLQRKRLLYGRYLGWSTGTPSRPGVIGPGLERVLHASVLQASPRIGLRLENPLSGNTSVLAGSRLAHSDGSLDHGATWIDDDGNRFAFPVEAKNLREWLYPSSQEPFQLLAKAVDLSAQLPHHRVVPILVCRRAQKTLFRFAADLGFHVIPLAHQYIVPTRFTDPDELRRLNEVRSELAFLDLTPSAAPDRRIVKQFSETLPKVAVDRSERWATYGVTFVDEYIRLRTETSGQIRGAILATIRDAMRGEPNAYDGEEDEDRGW